MSDIDRMCMTCQAAQHLYLCARENAMMSEAI